MLRDNAIGEQISIYISSRIVWSFIIVFTLYMDD